MTHYMPGADCRPHKAHRANPQMTAIATSDRQLSTDGYLLFATRIVRLLAYGFLSVVLVLYLSATGLSEAQIGVLLTLTLLGDTAISFWITTHADRVGRKRMLLGGAGLMAGAGIIFALTGDFYLLLLAATIGVISPSGNEVGPFLPIEQAALSHLISDQQRTRVFAWYNLMGSMATAVGALGGGALAQAIKAAGYDALTGYRAVVIGYAIMGLILAGLFSRLSTAVEAQPTDTVRLGTTFGLHRSRTIIARLSGLFALDAFAGGFIVQSVLAYWLYKRFGMEAGALGAVFFVANVLSGLSLLVAARLAARIGLINTMVFTHLPSNILLMLIPLMPNLAAALTLLLVRFSISQMDVPTRQSYTMAVVTPDERSAAAGITAIARTSGAAIAPLLAAPLAGSPTLSGLLFVIAGGLKVAYDLALYASFRALKPPEEHT